MTNKMVWNRSALDSVFLAPGDSNDITVITVSNLKGTDQVKNLYFYEMISCLCKQDPAGVQNSTPLDVRFKFQNDGKYVCMYLILFNTELGLP